MEIFERENLFIKGGILVYRTVVLHMTKCDRSDALIKLSLLSNVNKASFLTYKRYLNRLCTFFT